MVSCGAETFRWRAHFFLLTGRDVPVLRVTWLTLRAPWIECLRYLLGRGKLHEEIPRIDAVCSVVCCTGFCPELGRQRQRCGPIRRTSARGDCNRAEYGDRCTEHLGQQRNRYL